MRIFLFEGWNQAFNMRIINILFSIIQFLLQASPLSLAQNFTYFNNRYDITGNGSSDWISSVISTDKRYIVTGTSADLSVSSKFFLSILILDHQGLVSSFKTIGDEYSNYIFESPGSIIKYNDTTFFAVAVKRVYTSNWVHDQGMLICFNRQFDTTWSKYYGEKEEPYDTAYLLYQIKKNEENDLIMTGGWMPYGLPSRVWLCKTDSLGNKIWEKSFGNGYYYFNGYSVIQTSDGGYAIGAYFYEIGNDNSGDPVVIKTDSLGNQEWVKNLGGYYVDHKPMLCNSNDGNIIVCASIADSMLNPNYAYLRTTVVKLTNSGDIIWQKKYGESRLSKILMNTQLMATGDFLMSGYLYTGYPHIAGWLLEINSNGDSLWYREYNMLQGEDSENQLWDVIESTDNGIVACGLVIPKFPDTGTRDFWVIKLDSIGCLYPECDTTVGVIELPYAETEELSIYPNPAAEWLQVAGCKLQVHNRKSTSDKRQSTMYLCIYDIYGRKVEEIIVPEGQDQVRIDILGYRNGIYLAVFYADKQMVGRKKFVVAR